MRANRRSVNDMPAEDSFSSSIAENVTQRRRRSVKPVLYDPALEDAKMKQRRSSTGKEVKKIARPKMTTTTPLEKIAEKEYPKRKFKPMQKFKKIFGDVDTITGKEYRDTCKRIRKAVKRLRRKDESSVVMPALRSLFLSDTSEDSEEEDALRFRTRNQKVGGIRNDQCVKKTININFDDKRASKMNFFEPVGKDVVGGDELQLTNIPLVCEQADGKRLCADFYEVYPNGIHGIQENQGDVSTLFLFQLMSELLPNTTNPDLLYYCLYRRYPNAGSQEEFSEMFPKLVQKFVTEKNEQEKLLKLEEEWKASRNNKRVKKPVDYKHPCSRENSFVKTLLFPDVNDIDYCTESCYKRLIQGRLDDLNEEFNLGDATDRVQLFISKSMHQESKFFDMLVLNDENDHVKDFCSVARAFPQKTCAEWFELWRSVADLSEEKTRRNINGDKYFKKKMDEEKKKRQKQLAIDEAKANKDNTHVEENEKNTFHQIFPLTPCCHFGPCGPDVESCSCGTYCSVYCQCDIDCERKFYGCNCKTSGCKSHTCPCMKLGWECLKATCEKCDESENEEHPCRNKQISLGKCKRVEIKESNIKGAGNGAFIREDAKEGDLIGEYTGERISDEEEVRRMKVYNLSISYTFGLGMGFGCVDASRAGNAQRFLNHSAEANCYARIVMAEGEMRIGLFADRDIKDGTELTIDYGYTEESARKFFRVAPEDRVPKLKSTVKEGPKPSRRSVNTRTCSSSGQNGSSTSTRTSVGRPQKSSAALIE